MDSVPDSSVCWDVLAPDCPEDLATGEDVADEADLNEDEDSSW